MKSGFPIKSNGNGINNILMNINYGERLLALRFLQNCSQALAIGTRARAVIFVCALFLNLKNVSKLKLSILQF